ncbi:hypothetical protein OAI_12920 [Vibrio cyclitrophicus FF160]|nr:hypothetical protein OAI_12920 [Vibrio cyclitrophicus FF160]PMJ22263.1 hypothetical protein BCU28_07290 [Vibrio cyclitrophicus]
MNAMAHDSMVKYGITISHAGGKIAYGKTRTEGYGTDLHSWLELRQMLVESADNPLLTSPWFTSPISCWSWERGGSEYRSLHVLLYVQRQRMFSPSFLYLKRSGHSIRGGARGEGFGLLEPFTQC